MRWPAVVLLVLAALVHLGGASERLRESNQAWQAWLLLDSEAAPPQGDPPRRITPKSVFIAPSFPPHQLPPCADGYKADPMGRCVRIVRVDKGAHLDYVLRLLNAAYALPTAKPPAETENSAPQQQQQNVPSGPLQVSLPIANVPQAGGSYENDEESSPDVVLNIWELGSTNETVPGVDKQNDNAPKSEVNVENSLPMLVLSHIDSSKEDSREMTTVADTREIDSADTLYPSQTKKQLYNRGIEDLNSTESEKNLTSNETQSLETLASSKDFSDENKDAGKYNSSVTNQMVKNESVGEKEGPVTGNDNIFFLMPDSVPQQEPDRDENIEVYSTRTLPTSQETGTSDKIVFTDSSNTSATNDTQPQGHDAQSIKTNRSTGQQSVISVRGSIENDSFAPENDNIVQGINHFPPENSAVNRVRKEPEILVGDSTSKNIVRFPQSEGSYIRFPSDYAYRNVQPPRQWWLPPPAGWRPSYSSQPFIRYQAHGPTFHQRYYSHQPSNRYADHRYRRHARKVQSR